MVEDIVKLCAKLEAGGFRESRPLENIDVEVVGSTCAFRVATERAGTTDACRQANESGGVRINRSEDVGAG